MPQFIDTDRGYVNLDHVRRSQRRVANGKPEWTLFDAEDRVIGTVPDFDPGQFLPVISAAPCSFAVMVTIYGDGETPTADEMPILGWKVGSGDPEAVLLEAPVGNQMAFLRQPAGNYVRQYEQEFADIPECIAYAVEMLGKS